MKKILFVANVGKEHILKFHVPTIQAFKDKGWQVDVACAGDDPIPYCDTQHRVSWKRTPFTFKTFTGIREIQAITTATDYDVVYCHTPVGGLVARLGAKKARQNGTKVLYFAHGFHFFRGAPLINWLMFYPIEKCLARYTDALFTLNNEDYDRAKMRLLPQGEVVLTDGVGIDFSRLRVTDKAATRRTMRDTLGIEQDAPVLIYVAEIIKNKNQTMLIDAVQRLRQTHPNAILLLVGPENDGGVLKRYVDTHGLSDTVRFLGWRADIGELLHSADLCVASSIREGLPVNLLEAMYCGLPVIATHNRGHDTLITHGENGFLVDQGDAEAMASHAAALLSDRTLYERYAAIDVSRFESHRIAEGLYEKIAAFAQMSKKNSR